jgi:hypothetical protein
VRSNALLPAIAAALLLALVHLVTPALRFLRGTPRSAWLSISGGVSVAYVFVHLLPELAEGQEHLNLTGELGTGFAERHVYLVALAGLAIFYGLERLAKVSRGERPEGAHPADAAGRGTGVPPESSTSAQVFWIHMASFGVYNALIGYLLLHREKSTLKSLLFFALAMALHFVVTDYGLTEDHKVRFRTMGRWILVGAVFTGVAVGYASEISRTAIAVLMAFLAGGVILNVLKEEVPTERQSRFWPFAIGMAAYAGLLLTF